MPGGSILEWEPVSRVESTALLIIIPRLTPTDATDISRMDPSPSTVSRFGLSGESLMDCAK